MRRVFFSFHYQRDIFRVNVVRNSGVVFGNAAAGFVDASLWEKTKRKGSVAVKRLIDRGLEKTSVTCVLIGQETAKRKYIAFEIQQSLKRGNGLLGIHINNIENQKGETEFWRGEVPSALRECGVPIYSWDRQRFGEWVELAYQRAHEGAPKDIFEAIGRFFR